MKDVEQSITDVNGNVIAPNISGDGNTVNIVSEEISKISIRQSLIGKTQNFVGRKIFIDKIETLFRESNTPISIVGEAGLGKSQLAFEVIDRFQTEFSNVIIFDFTKFRGYEKFLTDFPTFLNLPTESFERLDDENKVHVIFDTLSKLQHVLIYADNFETISNRLHMKDKGGNDARLIVKLLKSVPSNTLMLLTSRIRKNLDSEKIVDLEGLEKEEGREMFLVLAQHYFSNEPSKDMKNSLEQISEKTGGHPLSIELLARSYKGNGIPELEEMLEHLGVGVINPLEEGRLQSLEKCFEFSIKSLDGNHTKQLSKLSVFSSHFTPQGAQEILGINHDVLQEYYDHGLLRRIDFDDDDPVEFRLYYFHLATKNYLQKQIDLKQLEQEVKESFVKYYKELSDFTYKSLSNEHRVQSINRFKTMMSGENDFEKAFQLNETDGSFIYNQVGLTLKNLGNYSGALDYLKRSLAIDEKNNDEVNMAIDYNNIGQILQDQGNLDGALEYTQKALAIFEKNNDNVSMSILYGNIGYILQDMKKESEAQEYFDKSSKIKERLGQQQ